jgi:hypothetical protein
MEYIEHKSSEKMEKTLKKIGHCGPLVGSLLGCVPQCGFSATASNLYTAGLVTEGTLIAVFLATSDEAIPILLSNPSAYGSIWKIIVAKIIIGICIGFGIDIGLKLLKIKKVSVDMCEDCGCEEENGILKPALVHTLKTTVFILIVNIVIGVAGNVVLNLETSYAGLMIGNVIAIIVGIILEFFLFSVDYTRAEHIQYEDDEYYYYVKAVPKVSIAVPEKTVKRISEHREVEDDDESEVIRRRPPKKVEKRRPVKRRPANTEELLFARSMQEELGERPKRRKKERE